MGIYIDNGKNVRHYLTNKNTEKAIMALLDNMGDVRSNKTQDGFKVIIVRTEDLISLDSYDNFKIAIVKNDDITYEEFDKGSLGYTSWKDGGEGMSAVKECKEILELVMGRWKWG